MLTSATILSFSSGLSQFESLPGMNSAISKPQDAEPKTYYAHIWPCDICCDECAAVYDASVAAGAESRTDVFRGTPEEMMKWADGLARALHPGFYIVVTEKIGMHDYGNIDEDGTPIWSLFEQFPPGPTQTLEEALGPPIDGK